MKAAFFRRGEVDFYKVAMQPGMPQGFGQIEGKPYFGLPGNPVSVFVSFEVFVRPAILKMMGRTQLFRPEVTATLAEDVDGAEGQAAVRAGPIWTRPRTGGRRRPPGVAARTSSRRSSAPTAWRWCRSGTATAPAGSEVRVMVFRSSED